MDKNSSYLMKEHTFRSRLHTIHYMHCILMVEIFLKHLMANIDATKSKLKTNTIVLFWSRSLSMSFWTLAFQYLQICILATVRYLIICSFNIFGPLLKINIVFSTPVCSEASEKSEYLMNIQTYDEKSSNIQTFHLLHPKQM